MSEQKNTPPTRGELLKQLQAAMVDVEEKSKEDNDIVVMIEIYNSILAIKEKTENFLKENIAPALFSAEKKLIEKMTAAGMTETRINGLVYRVRDVDAYSVKKENRELQLEWLESIGLAALIKEKYEITEDKTEFMKWLSEHKKAGAVVPIDRSVHYQTFNSFIKKEWPEIAETLPEDKKVLPEFVEHYEGKEISKIAERNGKTKR